MRNKCSFVVIVAVSLLLINSQNVHSQSPNTDGNRFEVGGQFSLLNFSPVRSVSLIPIPCLGPLPCPLRTTIDRSHEIQPGFGGRIGYNLTNNFALEGELNFFPGADSFSEPDAFRGGYKIEGLFGVKAGKRFNKIGIFGKARPGFLRASKGDLQPIPNTLCIAIFPPPVPCFETTSKTSFAFDVGGVVEFYPSKRTILRFEAGDTMIRFKERNVTAVLNPPPGVFVPSRLIVVHIPAETTHNFQGGIGIGFRF